MNVLSTAARLPLSAYCARFLVLVFVLAAVPPAASAEREVVRFEGLNRVEEREARAMISQQIEWIAKQGASPALADDAAFFLERALHGRGYPKADVVPVLDPPGEGLTLRVDEGQRRQLGDVTFAGNVAEVPEHELRGLLTRATKNRSSGIALGAKPLQFVERDIEAGLEEIAVLYQSLGYLDATTAPLSESSREAGGGAVAVTVTIDAGPPYKIGRISFSGEDDPRAATLRARLSGFSGLSATTENIAAARAEVIDYFRRSGHYKSEIELRSARGDGRLDLTFDVNKGASYIVGGIYFDGNERVNTDFLRRRFAALEGKPYSAADTEAVHRDLLSAGLFNTISIAPEERGADSVDLKVSVSEAKTRELAVVGGYGSFEGGVVGATLRERNLFGRGRQLGGHAELTGRGIAGDITYNDRWFFDSPLRFEAALFSRRKELEGYEKSETGLRSELVWPVSERFTASAFGQFSYTDVFDAVIDDLFLGDRTYRLGTIGISQSFDTRDNPLVPRRGFLLGSTLEYASAGLGSEVDFLRGTIRFTQHIPIGKRSELRLGARSGFMTTSEDTDEIPIDQRFFSGGSTSVRSFDERHLGPDDGSGNPVGGEFFTTFNAEYSFPLVGVLKGATFFDAGNLLGEAGDASLDDMHYAAGLGFRLDFPTGPVRVDYGWNLNRAEGEPAGAFHVSVGLAF